MGRPEPHQDGPVRRCKRRDQDVLAGGDVDDGDVGEVVAAGRRGRGRWRRFGCGRGWRWRWRWRRFGGRWRRRWRFVGREVAVRGSEVAVRGSAVAVPGVGGGGSSDAAGGGGGGGSGLPSGAGSGPGCAAGAVVVGAVGGGSAVSGGAGGAFSRRCGSLRRRWRWWRLGAAVRDRLGTRLRRRCGGGSGGGGLCVSALGAPAGGRDQRGDAQHGDAQQQDGGNCAAPVVAVVLWFADGHSTPSPSRSRTGGGVTASTVAACRIRVRRRCPARPPRRSRRSCLRRTHRPA